jgi:lysozyme
MAVNRMRIAALSLSASALVSMAIHEGFRDRAYDDGVGVQTIGFGTTEGVKPGDKITVERALVRLLDGADKHQREIRACLGDVLLFQHEFDAFASLAYNIGTGGFCRSTLVRKLKANPPDYEGACREILRWDMAGGKRLPGLTKRRQAEYRLCMGETT